MGSVTVAVFRMPVVRRGQRRRFGGIATRWYPSANRRVVMMAWGSPVVLVMVLVPRIAPSLRLLVGRIVVWHVGRWRRRVANR